MSNQKKTSCSPIFLETLRGKLERYRDIVTHTFKSINQYKSVNIYSVNEISHSIQMLSETHDYIDNLFKNIQYLDEDEILTIMEKINHRLCSVVRTHGTERLQDLLTLVYGKSYIETLKVGQPETYEERHELLCSLAHPISYQLLKWSMNQKEK